MFVAENSAAAVFLLFLSHSIYAGLVYLLAIKLAQKLVKQIFDGHRGVWKIRQNELYPIKTKSFTCVVCVCVGFNLKNILLFIFPVPQKYSSGGKSSLWKINHWVREWVVLLISLCCSSLCIIYTYIDHKMWLISCFSNIL